MKRSLLPLGIALLVVTAAGCGGGSKNSSSGSTEAGGSGSGSGGGQVNAAGVQANNHGSKTASDGTKVELDDYYFEPTILKGKPGQKIKLDLENEGSVEHSFTIDSQGVDQEIQPGDEAEVTVTVPKSGSVSFYCKFHKSSGMAGALVASGSSAAAPPTTTTTQTTSGGGGGGY
jgi:plastocyanin